MMMPGN
jgi:hypothetical protein